ncbi:zinc transporter ZIP1-like [Littorina saxatilis]|uniref:Uncharacterized protein n=1 Tax=Littorina saxatilis TaxID=31220 RepID=A0AAN9FW16_9CAEN
MDPKVTKGVAIIILFALTVVFGWLPIWLHHRGTLSASASPRRKIVLDVLNCFAGGVFLGTCLLHLLAEGREEFEDYKKEVGLDVDFPVYEALAAVGLFLVAFVEKIGFAVISFTRGNGMGDAQRVDSTTAKGSPAIVYSAPRSMGSANYGTVPESRHVGNSEEVNSSFVNGRPKTETEEGERQKLISAVEIRTPSTGSEVRRSVQGQGQGHAHAHDLAEQEHQHHHHSPMASTSCDPSSISQMSVMRALLLLVALSFHTIFDGLAVGLQETDADVWGVLLAISIHKSLVAFCLGLELAASSPRNAKRPWVFMFLFAFISPIGIGIGMGVTSGHVDERAQLLASSVLQALATGTFLYVTFFEILGQQFAHSHDSGMKTWVVMLKLFVAVVGFACMAGVKLLDTD